MRPSGDLELFRIGVRLRGWSSEVLVVTGQVEHDHLVVSSRGPLPMLDWTRTFPYQPRALVHDALGPLEWMPGLQVGQTWTSRVVSPLTG